MLPGIHDIKHTANPLVEMIYLKKEFNANGEESGDNVLVVKLKPVGHLGTSRERESEFIDLLANLDLLCDQVERKGGKFKRVDIQGPVMNG